MCVHLQFIVFEKLFGQASWATDNFRKADYKPEPHPPASRVLLKVQKLKWKLYVYVKVNIFCLGNEIKNIKKSAFKIMCGNNECIGMHYFESIQEKESNWVVESEQWYGNAVL